MSGFIRFLGSSFLFLAIVIIFVDPDIEGFFPDEYKQYADDLANNTWLLIIGGVSLSIIGNITNVRNKLTKNNKRRRMRNNQDVSHNISSHENASFRSSDHSTSYKDSSHNSTDNITKNTVNENHNKQDFIKQQHQYKGREFADKQSGQLREIAMKVDWTPLSGGGSNFKTSQLNQVNSSRLEVHKSKGGFLFSSLFAVIGLATMIVGSYFVIKDHGFSASILAPILFGGIFASVGILMFIFPRPRVFDRRYGWYWSGNKSLVREQDFMKLKTSARLSDIAAIQIIDERVSGSKGGSYHSWEINLVSENAERLNVMDHGNYESISADAQKLSDFLGVPIWENG